MVIRRTLLLILTTLCLACQGAANVAAQQMQVEVIELYARDADEMVRLLRPMLAPGGSIRGFQDKLVIRTTPQNLADLRRILDEVDAPPRQLLITLRQDTSSRRHDQELEVSGSVGGERARITVPSNSPGGSTAAAGRADGTGHVEVQIGARRSDASTGNVQTFRVIEGEAAFISVGESVPIRVQSPGGNPGGEAVEYHNIASGFYAVARVRGDTVTIQMASRADTVIDRNTGAAHIERISSVLSGRLGEWLEVGGVAQTTDRQQSGTIFHRTEGSSDQRRTYIKVENLR